MHRRVGFLMAIVVTSIIAVCGFIHAYRQYIANTPAMEPDRNLYPTRGIDISAHNGTIDFGKVKKAGYDFVIIKATEGTDFKDSMFSDNLRRAREAGLKVGAYHFFRFDTDGEPAGHKPAPLAALQGGGFPRDHRCGTLRQPGGA